MCHHNRAQRNVGEVEMTSSTPKKLCSGLCVVAVEAESASLLVDVRASKIAINVTCFLCMEIELGHRTYEINR